MKIKTMLTSDAPGHFDLDSPILLRPVQSAPTDESVLIEDLIDALREKERMIAELKQHRGADWNASGLAAWRRRFAALVVSSARPTRAP
jgi:hypothetical protein